MEIAVNHRPSRYTVQLEILPVAKYNNPDTYQLGTEVYRIPVPYPRPQPSQPKKAGNEATSNVHVAYAVFGDRNRLASRLLHSVSFLLSINYQLFSKGQSTFGGKGDHYTVKGENY